MARVRQRLLFRVVGLFAILLGVASIFSYTCASLLLKPQFDADSGRLEAFIASDACARTADHEPDTSGLKRYESTIYLLDGTLVRTWATPPFAPVEREALEAMKRDGRVELKGRNMKAFLCEELPGAYAVVGPSALRFSFDRTAINVVLSIVAVAIGAIPLVRSIVGPIERVAAATRAFGQGDFSVRAPAERQDEVGDLGTAFNEMAERLAQLMRAEKELMANVSHELRTPLARIRVVLESAQEDPERAQALLREIEYDLNDLERLVEDVMETMRLDIGSAMSDPHLTVRAAKVDVADFLANSAQRFSKNHPARKLKVNVPEGLAVRADERLLRRLIDNLLDNARKYSEDETPIAIYAAPDGESVRITVEDKGIGIDSADVEKVFLPFFRTDRSRSRKTGGVGLGLALAKRIIDAHNGKIVVESEPGKGTRVHVVLESFG